MRDRADPAQRHFVEMIPHAAVGLDQHALARVRLVDLAFDARKLLQQRLLVHDAVVRTDDAALLSAPHGAANVMSKATAIAPRMKRDARRRDVMRSCCASRP